jgi:hypothetical protein
MMAEFQVGDKVKHPKILDWGIGKVLETTPDNKVRVFVINAGEKLLGLKYVALEKVEGEKASHPILDNPTFTERAAKGKRHVSLPEARLDFLEIFSDGFEGTSYIDSERAYKVTAREMFLELLNEQEFSRLLEAGDTIIVSRQLGLKAMPTSILQRKPVLAKSTVFSRRSG